MAAPATHIVLADKVFNLHFKEKDQKVFYIGTSFPDIRYMGIIDREKTHFHNLTLDSLKSLPSFDAGLKFHSLVDKVREKFMQSKGVYSLIPESPFVTQALKFFEDKILYEKRKDWNQVAGYFKSVVNEESSFNIQDSDIEKWHGFLKMYFTTGPTDQNIRTFVAAIGRPNQMAEEIIRLTQVMVETPKVESIINEFYDSFEELL